MHQYILFCTVCMDITFCSDVIYYVKLREIAGGLGETFIILIELKIMLSLDTYQVKFYVNTFEIM